MEDSKPGISISEEDIEILNAHGPYSMAVWRSGNIEIGNEEGLKGRSAYFVERIRETILKNYTLDEIKGFSIADIGCNDGWVLHQLSDLPFARMVGVEPREKNVNKGKKVREILGLQNRVDYRIGDLGSIEGEEFDIVICAGVLYHVESIPEFLRELREICGRMLFIESRCLESKYITKDLKCEIEMRDLVYQYKEEICGITAQKFESAYHDGSTKEFCVVNVPTVESLCMYLDFLGFENIDIVADPETYRSAVWKNKRPLGGVCMAAFINPEKQETESEESSWIREYESGLEKTVLSRRFAEPLYNYFCLKKMDVSLFSRALNTYLYLCSPNWLSKVFGSMIAFWHKEKYEQEIIKNLRYSPHDKLCLEYGKLLHAEKRYEEAISVLKRVTTKLNADWRAVYRSFWLLSQIYEILGNKNGSDQYKELCLNCNPEFPL
jgi:ubiquinone/menaquinone biosynthesis C-methylase UbiE